MDEEHNNTVYSTGDEKGTDNEHGRTILKRNMMRDMWQETEVMTQDPANQERR